MFNPLIKPIPLQILFMLLILPVTPAWAALDNKGTDFILGLLPNINAQNTIELHLISEVSTSVTVEYPVNAPTFTSTVEVSPGTTTVVSIPNTASQGWTAGSVGNNALHVFAAEEFVVYMFNRGLNSRDTALALPVDTMSTSYRVLSAPPSQITHQDRSQFVVVAGFDETEVTITPTRPIIGGFSQNIPFTITLNRGEGFLGQGTTSGTFGDLSGTLIQATRPVGMTNGNTCANIPQNVSFCDQVFEVAHPMATWEHSTLVGTLPQRPTGSVYRIIASEDETHVTQDGVGLTELDAGQVFTTPQLPGNHIFEADKPIFVTQFMTSGNAAGAVNGDPSMANMIPWGQYSSDYTFSTVTGFPFNFLNIIAHNDDLATMLLDGFPLGAESFSPISGTDFSAATFPLAEGQHTTSSHKGHGITVGGIDTLASYLHPGGILFPNDGQPDVCDVNGDGKIDLTDATLIFAARGSKAVGSDDPRNPSKNHMITGQDVRICDLKIPMPKEDLSFSRRRSVR